MIQSVQMWVILIKEGLVHMFKKVLVYPLLILLFKLQVDRALVVVETCQGSDEDVSMHSEATHVDFGDGEAVLSFYARATVDLGLYYPKEVPVDDDPDLSRNRPRLKSLWMHRFSPGDSHSVSGTLILSGGCPIQWGKQETEPHGLVDS